MPGLHLPERAYSTRRDGRLSIVLHRSVAMVGPDHVEIRGARSAAWLPAAGLLAAFAAGTWIALSGGTLPFWLMVTLLAFCLFAAPLSVMGLVGAFVGADVVADGRKGSVTFQQGFLGMGVGTRELVPFTKIGRYEVTIEGDQPDRWHGEMDSLRQFAVVLEKTNGKRLVAARLPVPGAQQEEAMDRVLATAQALASLSDTRVDIPAGWQFHEVDATTLESAGGRPRGRSGRRRRRRGGR